LEKQSRNIEIKAKISNVKQFEEMVAKISDSGPTIIFQKDIFFKTEKGRLKLRMFSEQLAELIYYERSNTIHPTESSYIRYPCDHPKKMLEILSSGLGIRGVVEKVRTLYTKGTTRIHIDKVNQLSNFVEIEVVLVDKQSIEEGIQIAESFMKIFNIEKQDLLKESYIDLIEKEALLNGRCKVLD